MKYNENKSKSRPYVKIFQGYSKYSMFWDKIILLIFFYFEGLVFQRQKLLYHAINAMKLLLYLGPIFIMYNVYSIFTIFYLVLSIYLAGA